MTREQIKRVLKDLKEIEDEVWKMACEANAKEGFGKASYLAGQQNHIFLARSAISFLFNHGLEK